MGNAAAVAASNTPEYRIWTDIKRRCHQPHRPDYPLYGGKGVRVCDEWRKDFGAFIAHVGPRPSPSHSLDRIDGAKGYEPGNVRWADALTQQTNKASTREIVVFGEKMKLPDAARKYGIRRGALYQRIFKDGMTPEEAVTRPSRNSYDTISVETAKEVLRLTEIGLSRTRISRLLDVGEDFVDNCRHGTARQVQGLEIPKIPPRSRIRSRELARTYNLDNTAETSL